MCVCVSVLFNGCGVRFFTRGVGAAQRPISHRDGFSGDQFAFFAILLELFLSSNHLWSW